MKVETPRGDLRMVLKTLYTFSQAQLNFSNPLLAKLGILGVRWFRARASIQKFWRGFRWFGDKDAYRPAASRIKMASRIKRWVTFGWKEPREERRKPLKNSKSRWVINLNFVISHHIWCQDSGQTYRHWRHWGWWMFELRSQASNHLPLPELLASGAHLTWANNLLYYWNGSATICPCVVIHPRCWRSCFSRAHFWPQRSFVCLEPWHWETWPDWRHQTRSTKQPSHPPWRLFFPLRERVFSHEAPLISSLQRTDQEVRILWWNCRVRDYILFCTLDSIHLFISTGHTQDTSILKHATCSFTSSKVGITPPKTM